MNRMNVRRLSFPAALVFFVSLISSVALFGDEGDPPDRVLRLSYMQGAVSFEPSGENDWSEATLNYPVATGDRLWTDKSARVELETGNIAIRISAETDLTATNLSDQSIQLGLAQGTVRVRAFEVAAGHQIEIDTPNAALTVNRPGDYRVEVYPNENLTMLTVNSGEVEVTDSNGQLQTVGSGQAVRMTGSNPAQLETVGLPSPDDFDRWCNDRDRRYLASTSRRYVSPEVAGYYDLDQYGSWTTVADYGPVWYPAGLPVGWCPYRYGRWAWVEPWGWTWVEQEPWGFAPFHYGRWVLVGPRWGWVPGPIAVAPVYGPAFVAFVGSAGFSVGVSFGNVAWFPLGPGEPFLPWYHHSDAYLRQINVTNVRNINITNITNVTNITNINYRYKTTGITAVSTSAFRSAQPVDRNLAKVNPQQFAQAAIIPHPEVTPERSAIVGGAPAARPAVPPTRPAVAVHPPVTRGGAPATVARSTAPTNTRPAPSETHTPPPATQAQRTPPTNANEARTPPPNEARTTPTTQRVPPPERGAPPAPPAQNRADGTPTAGRPPLVTKTQPPPERVPFQQRQPAMQEHAGRPLEPQQRDNIREGKPAGPMVDREYPPHPPAEGAAPSHSGSPSHSEPSKEGHPKQLGVVFGQPIFDPRSQNRNGVSNWRDAV